MKIILPGSNGQAGWELSGSESLVLPEQIPRIDLVRDIFDLVRHAVGDHHIRHFLELRQVA